jgi:hypothetical protein
MSIDNGTQTFDPVNSELEFDAQIGAGYDMTFTLHTTNLSSLNDMSAGTTWYRHSAFGFGSGACVDGAGPDQDVQVALHVDAPSGVPDGYEQNAVEWRSWPEVVQITYRVVWHNATDPEPPSPPSTDDDEPEDDEEPEEDNEDDDLIGIIRSLFIFRNETTVVSAETIEQLPQENVDILEINGTLASYHFLNETRLYILSGNWIMAMNDTAVIDFLPPLYNGAVRWPRPADVFA